MDKTYTQHSKDCPFGCGILEWKDGDYMVFCVDCQTNFWIGDLLTKDPVWCGVTW